MTPTEPEELATSAADRAMAVVELARTGQFDEIRELFTPGLRPMVTAARSPGDTNRCTRPRRLAIRTLRSLNTKTNRVASTG